MAEDVYCTLLMSDSYLPGAAVLAHSLRDSGTTKKLAVLVTLDSLLHGTLTRLRELYDYVIPVQKIANPSLENLHQLGRLDLRFAFTKIALWRLEQFRKVVYIDADVVALRAPDELFDLAAPFAAAPDVGWPDIFNSGVMVLKPSMSEYWSLHTLASSGTSFDGADQGLFNEYFGSRPWHRLSFTYNCTPNPGYQYEPAYRYFRSSINMVHFIGKEKPWTVGRENLSNSGSGVYKELLGRWWAVYDRHYRIINTSSLGQVLSGARVVQQYVRGEQPYVAFEWAAGGAQPSAAPPSPPPPSEASMGDTGQVIYSAQQEARPHQPSFEIPTGLAEQPVLAPGVRSELMQPASEPQPEPEPQHETQPQPVFAPPPMAWDATRSEPPVKSTPEARDFPSAHYEMSKDPGLFRAPQSYPEPPKDMYYSIPETKPAVSEKPKPIFPWEQTARKPTRVFADDPKPGSEISQSESQTESLTPPDTTPQSRSAGTQGSSSSSTPSIKITANDPWLSYNRTNAWDEIASIDTYIRAVKQAQQARRGHVQVLHNEPPTGVQDFGDPSSSSIMSKRRESLILTDFPTEVERPSLPVTPAPLERNTFWGEERDADGKHPAAEGVPEQIDWNPIERLEQLRRSSVIKAAGMPTNPEINLPERDVPESSKGLGSSPPLSPEALPTGLGVSLIPGDSSQGTSQLPAQTSSESSFPSGAVTFRSPNFGDTNIQTPQSGRGNDTDEGEYSIA